MKIHRISNITLPLIMLVVLFTGNHSSVQAQGETDPSAISFAAFGEPQEILLNGPTDSTGIDFYFPAEWDITPGSLTHLNFRAYVGDAVEGETQTSAAGYLDIYMNDTWLQTVAVTDNGEYSIDVAIPDSAWRPKNSREPQSLRITMHDSVSCGLLWVAAGNGNWRSLNVAISPTSYMYLPHEIVGIPTDLRQLPFPLYQQTFRLDKALVVVPEFPTESELQAALIVEAALSRLTDGNTITSLKNTAEVAETDLVGQHIVFVGHASAFPQLDGVELPLKPSGGKFENAEIKAEDGILQLVPAPGDPAAVWLVVSGNDDAGIVKAAQALGSGAIRPYGPSNLAIVSSVQSQPAALLPTADMTLEDLGYKEQTSSAYGLVYFAYFFDVPPTQTVADGAFFELMYNNSALLKFEESGISIMLNDQFVGSARFSDRTTEVATVQFNILPSMFHAGKNLLLLEANLAGNTPCIPVDEIWVSIKPSSLLHLPFAPLSDSSVPSYDLDSYPQNIFPTMDHLAFILTRDDPTSWEIAATIASDIGQSTRNLVLQPSVAFADAIPDGLLETNSQIIIGRPSAIPLTQELAPYLPAPFRAGADIPTEPNSEFTFNVPANTPVGHLQILPSPWNNKQVILTVTGNSDQGLRSASNSLTDSTIRSQMTGNFAVIYDNQVIVDKVDTSAASTAAAPNVIVQSTAAPAVGTESGPFKLNFVTIGGIILFIIVVVGLIALLVRPGKTNMDK